MSKLLVSVVLGTYNRLQFLKLSIESIREELRDFPSEIIVVDGGSDDATLEWLCSQKDIITIVQFNRGSWSGKKIKRRSWGYFMNLGFKIAQGTYVCMLSDDAFLVPGALVAGVKHFEASLKKESNIGAVAFYARDWPTEKNYYVRLTLGDNMYVNQGLYRNDVLAAVAYIDEDNYFFYNGDADLCLKMWNKGYKVVDSPKSFVEHYAYANVVVRQSNREKAEQDLENFLKKWENIFYFKEIDNRGRLVELLNSGESKIAGTLKELHEMNLSMNPEIVKSNSYYEKIKGLIKNVSKRLNRS